MNIENLLQEYIKQEDEMISNLSNICSIMYNNLENVNWFGFYFLNQTENKLYLGPFQGKPATSQIALSAGVCGHAATRKETVIVDDVHCFEGHIACDLNSRSEIVVPVFDQAGNLFAIIDVDSPIKGRFGTGEQEQLEKISKMITSLL